jgi:hypothetical protein
VEVPSSDGLGSHGLVPKVLASDEPPTHRPAWDAAPVGGSGLSDSAGVRAGAVSLTCESPATRRRRADVRTGLNLSRWICGAGAVGLTNVFTRTRSGR